jgi:hypothetical protein
VTDEIVLTLPRDRRFYDVAHLVVGGLAARVDLTVDSLSDLQVALDELLPREEADGEITVELRLDGQTLDGRIGPYPPDALRRELDRDGDGIGTQRVLTTIFESYRVDEDESGAWVAFTMAIQARDGEAA